MRVQKIRGVRMRVQKIRGVRMRVQKFRGVRMRVLFIRMHTCVLHMTLCMHDLFSRLCKLVVLHLIIWACVETKIILFFVHFCLYI